MAYQADRPSTTATTGDLTKMGKARYPWLSWADGKVWVLTRGDDYLVTRKRFIHAAAIHAKRSGLRLEWQDWQRGKLSGVVIQFHADTEAPREIIDL